MRSLIRRLLARTIQNRITYLIFYYVIFVVFRGRVFRPGLQTKNIPLRLHISSAMMEIGKREASVEILSSLAHNFTDDVRFKEQLGISSFLAGDYNASRHFFQNHHDLRAKLRDLNQSQLPIRILDHSWTPAIGHIAHLAIYFKALRLGWLEDKETLLFVNPDSQGNLPSGWPMLKYFKQLGLKIVQSNTSSEEEAVSHLEEYFSDLAIEDQKQNLGQKLTMFRGASYSFWYGRVPDQGLALYGAYGAAVNQEWDQRGYAPIVGIDDDERRQSRLTMKGLLGLPEDAWYVVLHVREAGYHLSWHQKNPGTRNADITTYQKAIDYIIEQGGWVVRAGDQSMQRFPKQDRVIDYATTPQKSPDLDISLCANCEYFIGTNSGFSLVPGVFGKRSLLTNWSPMAIPNWYKNDIFVPKKIWHKKQKRFLSAEEMMQSIGGWSQFKKDFDLSDLKVVDNSPEELLAATLEMHEQVMNPNGAPYSASERAKIDAFEKIIVENEGYVGSQISATFLQNNADFVS